MLSSSSAALKAVRPSITAFASSFSFESAALCNSSALSWKKLLMKYPVINTAESIREELEAQQKAYEQKLAEYRALVGSGIGSSSTSKRKEVTFEDKLQKAKYPARILLQRFQLISQKPDLVQSLYHPNIIKQHRQIIFNALNPHKTRNLTNQEWAVLAFFSAFLGEPRHGQKVYDSMRVRNQVPDSDTFCAILRALARGRQANLALKMLQQMTYHQLPIEQRHRNAVLEALFASGRKLEALQELEKMETPNIHSFNIALDYLSREKQLVRDAVVVYDQMINKGFKADRWTCLYMVRALSLWNLGEGKWEQAASFVTATMENNTKPAYDILLPMMQVLAKECIHNPDQRMFDAFDIMVQSLNIVKVMARWDRDIARVLKQRFQYWKSLSAEELQQAQQSVDVFDPNKVNLDGKFVPLTYDIAKLLKEQHRPPQLSFAEIAYMES